MNSAPHMYNEVFLMQCYIFLSFLGEGAGENSAVSMLKKEYCLFAIPTLSVFD